MKPALTPAIAQVRRFNRFYTQQIGVLSEGLLKSPYSLTEVRVLYELAHRPQPTASAISRDLALDPGYLSRILRRFQKEGLLRRTPSKHDARQSLLSLTPAGKRTFAELDRRQDAEVRSLLERVPSPELPRVVESMQSIERTLTARAASQAPFTLRSHRPGDMGWVVHRHGVLYWQEYGWGEWFEALVAEIVAKFIQNFDSKRERCWIAERDGAIIGSIFLVKKTDTVAKLRLLLVEPSARGLGLGRRLVHECIEFARAAGYRKVTLWTQNNLHSARKIYEAAGFKLVHEELNPDFGTGIKSQNWDLVL